MATILAAILTFAVQSADSTLVRLEALGLPLAAGDFPVWYVENREARALALQRATDLTAQVLRDSLGAEPPPLVLAVLDEPSWERVVPWELPYGIHQVVGPPHVFLAPSETDRGQYFDPDDDRPELRVDLIGLHYLAHHLASGIYPDDPSSPASPERVKWLDEVLTLLVEGVLLDAFNPELVELRKSTPDTPSELRVTTLRGFEIEYNGYFSSREGGANYAWFLNRLRLAGDELISRHGWASLRRLRPKLARVRSTEDALSLLEEVDIAPASLGLPPG